MSKSVSKIISSVIIALGVVMLGVCIKSGIDNFSYSDRVVTVRGLAEKEVMANKVTWPIVFKEMGNDLPQIYASINKTNNAIVEFLKTNGLSADEIEINAPDIIDMQADRYSSNNKPYRYNVTSVITVISGNVGLVNDLISRQAELLKQGIAIVSDKYSYPTNYEFTDLNTVKPEMIAEATCNAREAACKFAADSESKLGKIKTASQGQFTISDRDEYTPYVKNVRVVTTIVYYLED